MSAWRTITTKALRSGTVASLASTAALTLLGWLEGGRPAAPNNGPSQWIWGRQAAFARRPSLKHTLMGYAVHHAMSIFWAVLHERIFRRSRPRSSAALIAQGLTTAAVASFVDYRLTPKRLEPGFDKHLSRKSLTLVYAAFGVGLIAIRLAARVKR